MENTMERSNITKTKKNWLPKAGPLVLVENVII